MNLSVIIPFRNGHREIDRTVRSLPERVPVTIVDDHSRPALRLSHIPSADGREVRILRLAKRGYFAGAVNRGIAESPGQDILVLNQDVTLQGDAWLQEWAELRSRYALWGDGVMEHPAWPMGYVQGTFMMIRADAIEKVGLLNERDYPLWGGTAEWQLRACRAGYKVKPQKLPEWFAHHRKEGFGASIRAALQEEPDKKRLLIRTPPMISVIVPSYNYGRYIPDAIASLLGGQSSLGPLEPQSFQSFEIVIVDDASQDETHKIATSFVNPWKGIRFIRRKANGGSAAAYNTGIKQSYGRYVTILSADDMREPWALEELYRLAEGNPGKVVYDDVRQFEGGQKGKAQRFKPYKLANLIERNFVHAGVFYPREAYKAAGGYPEAMKYGREDWAFALALARAGWYGVHLAKAGYLYRREGQNRSLTNTNPRWREVFLKQLASLFPDLYGGGKLEELLMACCPGGRGRRGSGGSSSRKAEDYTVGKDGMVLLQYIGGNQGTMTFLGVATRPGQRYRFGLSRPLGYVDARDAAHFLKLRDGRKLIFRPVDLESLKPAEVSTMETVVKDETPTGAPAEGTGEPDWDVEGAEEPVDPLDPGKMKSKEIRAMLKELNPDQMADMLEAELRGRGRKSVIGPLKAKLKV